MPTPRNGRGRPPAKGAALATITSAATAKRQGTLTAIVGPDGPWHVEDLPATIAARIIVMPGGCWLWTGRVDRDGYGRHGGQGIHRIVYNLLVGHIPPERPQLDHVAARGCLFRACCWPGHLEPVTVRENALRGRSFAAVNAAKVRCDHGHPYDAVNTYIRPNGHRDCRACFRRRSARYAARQRLAKAA